MVSICRRLVRIYGRTACAEVCRFVTWNCSISISRSAQTTSLDHPVPQEIDIVRKIGAVLPALQFTGVPHGLSRQHVAVRRELSPIDALATHRELCRTQTDLYADGTGPNQTAPPQLLREEPDSTLRSPDDFYKIALSTSKGVNNPAYWTLFRCRLRLCSHLLKSQSHVSNAHSNPNVWISSARIRDRRPLSKVRSMSVFTGHLSYLSRACEPPQSNTFCGEGRVIDIQLSYEIAPKGSLQLQARQDTCALPGALQINSMETSFGSALGRLLQLHSLKPTFPVGAS